VYKYVGRLVPIPAQAFELIESTYNVIGAAVVVVVKVAGGRVIESVDVPIQP
jgi:hypothetical protein